MFALTARGSPSLPNTWHIHHHCNWLAMSTNSHDRHKKNTEKSNPAKK
jgi:hypothetical protein